MQRCFARSVLALAAISLAVLPGSAPGETTEPVPTTETPPASTGWVPQGGASEGTGGGASGAQQGSSLGSGSSPSTPAPEPAPAPSPPPVSTAPPPAPEPSTSYEAEAPAEAAAPEPALAPEPEPAPAKPEPEPSPPVDAHVALGSADAVLVGSGEVKGVSMSSASTATTAPVAPESGGLPWLALIVFGLILVVAGARLVLGPIEADSLRYSRFRILRRAAPRG